MRQSIFIVCIGFILCMAAGCNNGDAHNELWNHQEIITVTVSQWDVSYSFGNEPCEIYVYILQRFGLRFEPVNVMWDNSDDMLIYWAARDNLPDVLGAANTDRRTLWQPLADRGLLRPLPEDLSDWPIVEQWIASEQLQQNQHNGKNWILPRSTTLEPMPEITALATGIINRRDWRELLNINIPKTEQDFLDMWQAFVDNAEILPGAASVVYGVIPNSLFMLWGQNFAGRGDTQGIWSLLDGYMVIPAFEQHAAPLLFFWRDAFNQGLLDPAFITNVAGVGMHDFAAGRVGTLLRQVTPVHLNSIYYFWSQPGIDFLDAVEILQSPVIPGITPVYHMGTGFWSGTLLSNNLSDEAMERLLHFFDWSYTEEAVMLMTFGFEGRDWHRKNGEIIVTTPIDPETGRHGDARFLYHWTTGGMQFFANWAVEIVEWFNPKIPEGIRDMAWANRERVLVPERVYHFRDSRVGSHLMQEITDIRLPSVAHEWVWFITNTTTTTHEVLWRQMRERLESAGYLYVQELMKAAYMRLP